MLSEPLLSEYAAFKENNPFDVYILEPKQVRLYRSDPTDARVRMTLADDRSWRDVRVARAFPFSDPDHYIGLRDGDDKDIGMLVKLEGLDSDSRTIIATELERRYFTPQVHRVISVQEQHGTTNWEVETTRGIHRFVVRNLRDNTFSLGPNRLMMTDTEGNRYEFPDVTAVGSKAYRVLAKVVI